MSRHRVSRILALTCAAAWSALVAGAGAPRMATSATAFDFGSCGHRQTLTREITITNEGTEVLRIEKVKKSCDCTKVQLDRVPVPRSGEVSVAVAPGGTARLTTVLSTGRIMGFLQKYVEVQSNDPARRTVRLPVLAHVHDDVKAIPWSLPQFTAIAGAPPITQEFTLVWLGKPEAETPLEDLKARHASVTVRAVPLSAAELKTEFEKLKAQRRYVKASQFFAGYRIQVSITPPPDEGAFSTDLTATVNGKPWEFPVRGYVFAGIVVEPRYFQFGGIEDAQAAEQTIVLRSADETPFSIVAITSSPDILAFEVDSDEDGLVHRITARIAVADRSKRFYAKVTVETSHPKKPSFEVSCLGFWKQQKGT